MRPSPAVTQRTKGLQMPIKVIPETAWFPVFKVGTHKDGAGRDLQFTEEQIDEIIRMNEGRLAEVKAVLGHPRTDDPAYGETGALKKVVKDGVAYLYAKLKNAVAEFAEMVNAGMYNRVSIALYPDLRLRHIGFLGATPPAVKGLAPVQFEDGEAAEMVIEFSEREQWAMSGALKSVGRMFQRLRDFLVGEYGAEKADTVVPSEQLDWLREDAIEVQPTPEPGPVFNEPHPDSGGDMPDEKVQQQLEELQGQFNELKAQLTTVTQERDALKGTIAESERKQLRTECMAFADALVNEGRLIPAQRDIVVGVMEQLAPAGEYEFAEGVSEKPLDAFKKLLRTYPERIEFAEVATKGAAGKGGAAGTDELAEFAEGDVDEGQLAMHRRALEIQKSDGVSYRDAVTKAMRE